MTGAIKQWAAITERTHRAIDASHWVPKKMTQLAEKIGDDAFRDSVPNESLDALFERISSAVGDGLVAKLPRRDLRNVGRVLWRGEQPLAQDSAALGELLEELFRRGGRAGLRNVISAYLMGFQWRKPGMDIVAAFIEQAVRFHKSEWTTLAEEYRLFKPKEGVDCLAGLLLQSDDLPTQVLSKAGIRGTAVRGGFCETVYREYCRLIETSRGAVVGNHQNRLLDWLGLMDQNLFVEASDSTANALLIPWAENDPPEELATKIRDYLIGALGDPRFSPIDWSNIPEAMAIFLRWLTRASIYQFLDIVDQVTRGTPFSHQWPYRRAFWLAYLDADHIENAWVIFGREAAETARLRAESTGDRSWRQFGVFNSGQGRSPQHAGLILEIGDLVILDWSHNGRYSVWKKSAEGAPALFQRQYNLSRIQDPEFYGSHSGTQRYSWQHTLANYLRQETGIRMPQTQWMV